MRTQVQQQLPTKVRAQVHPHWTQMRQPELVQRPQERRRQERRWQVQVRPPQEQSRLRRHPGHLPHWEQPQ
jgi:hypothetical protein